MLRLTKHSNLNISVLNISGKIITILRDKNILPFNELLDLLIKDIGENVKEVYLPSLGFLYLTGKIEYHQQIDSVEFLE